MSSPDKTYESLNRSNRCACPEARAPTTRSDENHTKTTAMRVRKDMSTSESLDGQDGLSVGLHVEKPSQQEDEEYYFRLGDLSEVILGPRL